MDYPRPIESIHQIEISSRCNLRCVYCPSPKLDKPVDEGGFGREKEDITVENFARALEWAKHFQEAGTQGELALTGIGEALLHPQFVDLLRMAREALPDSLITFSTNGLLLTREMCEQIAPYQPRVFVSLHRPEKAKHAVDAAREFGLLESTNVAFALDAFDWAGALDWEVSTKYPPPCAFLSIGWCVVLADGRITTCCLDASGGGVVGSVWDEIGSLGLKPWFDERVGAGCKNCHMRVP